MKPHDYSGLNDAQCVYVDHFLDRLRHWRLRNLAEGVCFQVARREAGRKVALDEDEQAGVDANIAATVERRRNELPAHGLVVLPEAR